MNAISSNRPASFFGRLGPGLLLAATSIGASHLVMSPAAGAAFGYRLLWLVTLTHVFKYFAFEFGPRYAAATGESLIAGYNRLPGPRGWALWIFLAGTVAQGIGVLGAVVGIAAAVLYTFVGYLPLGFYAAGVIATVLLFLLFGGYGWLDSLNKVMMAALFAATVVVFVPACPGPRAFARLVIPSIPAGSIALAAAILGWMPTGIDVSVWHSIWTLKKHPELCREPDPARRSEILRLSLLDMRIGYGLSFVVACVFLLLAAVFLHGRGLELKGAGFAATLAGIYTESIGRWMYLVFMVAAFFAMYSTSYTVMDGFSRSFAEALSVLLPRRGRAWWSRFYWGFAVSTASLALAVLLVVGNPVRLVMVVASVLSLCVAPLYYWCNYYCVSRFIEDRRLRPGGAARVTALAGVVVMFAASVLYIASELGFIGN